MNTAVAEAHDLGWKLAWALHGWAGPALLDTYEAEWRPVGARRAARSALEGPAPDGSEALTEDLNGRLPHAWLPGGNGHRRSTLDLLGPGLTLLTGPAAPPGPATTPPRSPLRSTPSTPGPRTSSASAPPAPSWSTCTGSRWARAAGSCA
ncbi:MAG TPA: FAD-dependent monooxygenase [Actinomycetes bacterium]|nr:FAD-dependent monooxygenase [Actinomycetes bacterium]